MLTMPGAEPTIVEAGVLKLRMRDSAKVGAKIGAKVPKRRRHFLRQQRQGRRASGKGINGNIMEVSAARRVAGGQDGLNFGDRKSLRELLAIERASGAQFDIEIGERLAGQIKKRLGCDGGLIVEKDDQLRVDMYERQLLVRNG